jgi:AGZA family xanthine/uracil permease-like MFS transporter
MKWAPVRARAERHFALAARGTSLRTEVLGGLTTFLTMAYIVVVNPAIFQGAFPEVPRGAWTVATILAAVSGTLLMGLYANRPLAVAPYMGENAFVVFTLAAIGFGWQLGLGAVFVSGLAFLVITLLGVRAWLAEAISPSLKHSFAVGIGLFLAFIGLYGTGIVSKSTKLGVPLQIGEFNKPEVLLALGGFLVMVILMAWRLRGAILVGIVLTAVAGYLLGLAPKPTGVVALPFAGDYSLAPVFLQLDVRGLFSKPESLQVLLTLFLMSFLDTLGTLVGVGAAGNMLDARGNFPEIERPMLVDALACMFSALIGTSTSGAYIESATGIRDGARTGLAAVTTAVLFAVALFFLPLFEPLQQLRYAYGPALIAVGMLMMGSVTKIDFADLTEVIPAFVTIAMMVFTYNIGNGLTAGLALYPLVKVAAGRFRELRSGMVALSLLCLVYYLFGLPH